MKKVILSLVALATLTSSAMADETQNLTKNLSIDKNKSYEYYSEISIGNIYGDSAASATIGERGNIKNSYIGVAYDISAKISTNKTIDANYSIYLPNPLTYYFASSSVMKIGVGALTHKANETIVNQNNSIGVIGNGATSVDNTNNLSRSKITVSQLYGEIGFGVFLDKDTFTETSLKFGEKEKEVEIKVTSKIMDQVWFIKGSSTFDTNARTSNAQVGLSFDF